MEHYALRGTSTFMGNGRDGDAIRQGSDLCYRENGQAVLYSGRGISAAGRWDPVLQHGNESDPLC